MENKDFFKDRTEAWCFDDVIVFINNNFDIKAGGFAFRVGEIKNNPDQNQQAGLVLAYAKLMNYTFNQVKALFSEHDHFSIAMPESRKGKNILELNNIYFSLLKKGYDQNIKINDFPDYFDIPTDILTAKK